VRPPLTNEASRQCLILHDSELLAPLSNKDLGPSMEQSLHVQELKPRSLLGGRHAALETFCYRYRFIMVVVQTSPMYCLQGSLARLVRGDMGW
jgi:hypothetical protein